MLVIIDSISYFVHFFYSGFHFVTLCHILLHFGANLSSDL